MTQSDKHITALIRIRDTKMRVAKVCNNTRLLEEIMDEVNALNFCISMIESVLYSNEEVT